MSSWQAFHKDFPNTIATIFNPCIHQNGTALMYSGTDTAHRGSIGAVSEAQSSCVRRLYCKDPGETSSENEELDWFCFLL